MLLPESDSATVVACEPTTMAFEVITTGTLLIVAVWPEETVWVPIIIAPALLETVTGSLPMVMMEAVSPVGAIAVD